MSRLQIIQLDSLAEELDLPSNDQLEEFVIDAIQVNAISVRTFKFFFSLSFVSHKSTHRESWMKWHER